MGSNPCNLPLSHAFLLLDFNSDFKIPPLGQNTDYLPQITTLVDQMRPGAVSGIIGGISVL